MEDILNILITVPLMVATNLMAGGLQALIVVGCAAFALHTAKDACRLAMYIYRVVMRIPHPAREPSTFMAYIPEDDESNKW